MSLCGNQDLDTCARPTGALARESLACVHLDVRVHSSLKADCNVGTDSIAISAVPPYFASYSDTCAVSADMVLELDSGNGLPLHSHPVLAARCAV